MAELLEILSEALDRALVTLKGADNIIAIIARHGSRRSSAITDAARAFGIH